MQVIAVIGAFEKDIVMLLDLFTKFKTEEYASKKFHIGILYGNKVIVVASGIGKINAAITAQVLCDIYDVNILLNIGIAGGISPSVEVGDIILSLDFIQHDFDLSKVGCPLGVVPKTRIHSLSDDTSLLTLAYERCALLLNQSKIHKGRVCSGDQFISSASQKENLYNTFMVDCVDMEGAAIAQTAVLNNRLYLLVKYISDNADESASLSYKDNQIQSIQCLKNIVHELLMNISNTL